MLSFCDEVKDGQHGFDYKEFMELFGFLIILAIFIFDMVIMSLKKC